VHRTPKHLRSNFIAVRPPHPETLRNNSISTMARFALIVALTMKVAVGLQLSHNASERALLQPRTYHDSASDGGFTFDGTIEEKGQNVSDCCRMKFNIINVRIPKCASSTLSGILRGYASKNNLSGVTGQHWICKAKNCSNKCIPTWNQSTDPTWQCDEPGLYSNHFRAYDPQTTTDVMSGHKFMISQSVHQLRLPSILVTFLREIKGRQRSRYMFRGGCKGRGGSLQQFIDESDGNYQYEYIRESRHETVSDIVRRFTFIGVVERFDESVVQLFSMLHTPLVKAVYLRSKPAKCNLSSFPNEFEDYLNGHEFSRAHVVDIALYNAANNTLTNLMQGNRKPAFQCGRNSPAPAAKERAVQGLKKNNALAEEKCGEFQDQAEDCYTHDFGCGIKCLAQINHFKDSCTIWGS